MKFKNKEIYPLELWRSYKTVLFQSQAVLNKWGLCWQNCTFWIAGLLWAGRAGRQRGNQWPVPLWHVPEEPSLLAAQHLKFWSSGVGWRALAVSGYLLMQGSFFRECWWAILWPGVNSGMCMLQGFQEESSFQESLCTLAAVTFHWENKSRIKIFFSSESPL